MCHCIDCVGWAGGPWPSSAAHRDHITVAGIEHVRWLPTPDSAEGVQRASCSACGTALFRAADDGDTVGFAAGTLDDATGLSIAADVRLGQAPAWDTARTGAVAAAGSYPDVAPPIAWHDA